jgi:endoglucanase
LGYPLNKDGQGDCTAAGAYPPLTQYYGPDGYGQMEHFVKGELYRF